MPLETRKRRTDWTLASKYTDTIVTRVIIFRMLMLQRSADVEVDAGAPYTAKPYSYWMESLAISRYQLTCALKILRDKGLVETIIKKCYGNPVLHIRLGTMFLGKSDEPCVRIPDKVVCKSDASNCANSEHTIKKEVSLGGKMEEEENFVFLTPPGAATVPEEESPVVSDTEKIINGAPTFASLKKIWSIHWKEHQTGPIDGLPGSAKVMAQWKQFVKKANDYDRNPLQLIANVLADWQGFRSHVKTYSGKQAPTHPQIWFVFSNFATVLICHIGSAKAAFEYAEGDVDPNDLLLKQFPKK